MTTQATFTTYAGHSSATYIVTTQAELAAALSAADAGQGGTIYLDSNGGPFSILANGIDGSNGEILIRSLDPNAPALVQDVDILNSSFITLDSLEISSVALSGSTDAQDINVRWSDNIEITNNYMWGDANGPLDGTGTYIKGIGAALFEDSSNITFSGNYITDYGGGVGYLNIKGLDLSGNELTQIQTDGFQGGGIQNATISDNYMHNFYGSTQSINHSDFIQIWGVGVKLLTTDVTISGNVLDSSGEASAQGIFIRNESFGQSGTLGGYYQNIQVFDNVVHTADWAGISVADTQNLQIDNNTVLWDEGAWVMTTSGTSLSQGIPWISTSNAPGASVMDNISWQVSVNGQAADSSNYLISYDDPNSSAYYENHFVNLSGGGDLDLRDLSLLPNSPLYGNVGAPLSSSLSIDDPLVAVMRSDPIEGNRMAVDLSADFSYTPNGFIDPTSASFTWTFDDGTVVNGSNAFHTFATSGQHSVTLDVTDASGNSASVTRIVNIDAEENFKVNFDNGLTDSSGQNAALALHDHDGDAFVSGLSGKGFHLTSDDIMVVSHTNDQLFGLDTFNLDLDFKLDSASTAGGIVGLFGTFQLEVMGDGSLQFSLKTSDGNFKVQSAADTLSSNSWANISVQYDGPAGKLDLVVDGQVVGSAAASGTTAAENGFGIELGKPWGTNAHGVIDNFEMSSSASEIYSGVGTYGTTSTAPVSTTSTGTLVLDTSTTTIDTSTTDTATADGNTDSTTETSDEKTKASEDDDFWLVKIIKAFFSIFTGGGSKKAADEEEEQTTTEKQTKNGRAEKEDTTLENVVPIVGSMDDETGTQDDESDDDLIDWAA